MPAGVSPPPPPPKAAPKSVQTQKALQDIIDSITKEPSTTPALSSHSAEGTPKEKKKKPVEKWRSLPIEKQMKLYENTVCIISYFSIHINVFLDIKFVKYSLLTSYYSYFLTSNT